MNISHPKIFSIPDDTYGRSIQFAPSATVITPDGERRKGFCAQGTIFLFSVGSKKYQCAMSCCTRLASGAVNKHHTYLQGKGEP